MPRDTYPTFTGYAVAAEWTHRVYPLGWKAEDRVHLLLRPIDPREGEPWRAVMAPGPDWDPAWDHNDFAVASLDALVGLAAQQLAKLRHAGSVIAAAEEERASVLKSGALADLELHGFDHQTSRYAQERASWDQRYGRHTGAVERL